MTQTTNKDQILTSFAKLLSERQNSQLKVATKEEEAEKDKNQELLEQATAYTVDNIVNSMASLQLDFGNVINEVSIKLSTEVIKLDELKRAIIVQTENLDQIKKVRLVADALHLLRQEHQEKLRVLEEQTNTRQEAIEKEREQARKNWEQEQQEFALKTQEESELLAAQREQSEADYLYEIERDRQIEMDEYEEARRLQIRDLAELNQDKEKAWIEREGFLADNQAEFQENQQKIAGFEEELKQAYNKVKGDAIKEAERQAKVASDLLEKEWEASKQGYDLQLTSLSATIERQGEQIAELTQQLQAATTQAQNLAMRAFQSSASQTS